MQSKDVYKSYISICFSCSEVEEYNTIIDSMYPELTMPINSKKTSINISIDPPRKCIYISISTYSLSQIRAIINSILYLTNTTLCTLNVLRKLIK
jgi:tRNA threonylcarbamoyladenosine modification (KEOPS) complex  Pcc1 subunit